MGNLDSLPHPEAGKSQPKSTQLSPEAEAYFAKQKQQQAKRDRAEKTDRLAEQREVEERMNEIFRASPEEIQQALTIGEKLNSALEDVRFADGAWITPSTIQEGIDSLKKEKEDLTKLTLEEGYGLLPEGNKMVFISKSGKKNKNRLTLQRLQ